MKLKNYFTSDFYPMHFLESIFHFKKLYYFIIVGLITCFLIIFKFSSVAVKDINQIDIKSLSPEIQKMHYFKISNGILKFENDKLIVYIKSGFNFYSPDHSPVICWRGSGYKVICEQIINIAGKDVYFNKLNLNKDTLYTTWWYDSGEDKTISQFRWRSRKLLHNKDYKLVNVICYDKSILLEQTKKLINFGLISNNEKK